MASQSIDMPLRKNCSQPGDQAAAAVEVAEERLAFAASLAQPEELAVQRIGEIASAATGFECIRRTVQQRPMLQNKVLPCVLVAMRACTRQREVFQVQAREVLFETSRCPMRSQGPLRARLERL